MDILLNIDVVANIESRSASVACADHFDSGSLPNGNVFSDTDKPGIAKQQRFIKF
jgi:hypothetical protein